MTTADEQIDARIMNDLADTRPVHSGRRCADWDVADPADQPLGAVSAIRDDIEYRVRNLLTEVLPTAAAATTGES